MEDSVLGPIATLDSRLLGGRTYEDCLSERERQGYSRFRSPLRKGEWLSARLCSKYLFLEGAGGDLSTKDLDRFPSAMYRELEVTQADDVNFGLPRVGNGVQFSDAAISHTNGIACVLLGNGRTISVDIEHVEPRNPIFYRGNFTEAERIWAQEWSRDFGVDPHWSFTLLWSMKECLLKTPICHRLSLWDMPKLHLRIASAEIGGVREQSRGTVFGGFQFLNIEASFRDGTLKERVAVSGRRDMVITAIGGIDRRMV